MEKVIAQFDAVEIQFFKDAYIALAVRLIDPNKIYANNDSYWQARIDLADTIATEMTTIFQTTREIHEGQ